MLIGHEHRGHITGQVDREERSPEKRQSQSGLRGQGLVRCLRIPALPFVKWVILGKFFALKKPNAQHDGGRRWGFGRYFALESGPLMNGIGLS